MKEKANRLLRLKAKKIAKNTACMTIVAGIVLSNGIVPRAGVDVWTKTGEKITDVQSLTQENIGTIQYSRGATPQRYAGFDTFKTTWTIDEVIENGVKVHYVNVKHVFNERRDRFTRHFVVFNIPKSLYEPEYIVRKVYEHPTNTTPTNTWNFSTWTSEPRPITYEGKEYSTSRWAESKRYVRPNPQFGEVLESDGQVAVKQIAPNTITDRISVESGRWEHDWSRIDWRYQTDGNGVINTKTIFDSAIKDQSRSIYIDDRSAASHTVTYEFRARVKDYNAPMNFLLGYNQAAGGWNSYAAVFGETPDNRPYNVRFPLTLPQKTIVNSLEVIDENAKNTIKQRIQAANADLFNENNSTKKAVTSIEKITVPSSANNGEKVIVEYTDGTRNEINMSAVVVKKVVATPPTTTMTPPAVVTALQYNEADRTAETPMGNKDSKGTQTGFPTYLHTYTEKQSMTRIQLPEKKTVTDVGALKNPSTTGLDPNNSSKTAQDLWNEKLREIKQINNIAGTGRYPTGTAINGIGTRSSSDGVTEDSSRAHLSSAELKITNGVIEGILIRGPRYGDEQVVDAGIITSDMLFKKQEAVDPLPPLKEQAKQTIEGLQLSNTDKDNFKNQITAATSQEEIERIVGEAKKKEAEIQKAKEEAKAEIDKLTYLTEQEKTTAKQNIDSKFTKEEVAPIVDEAVRSNLEKAKQKANEAIAALEKLPQDQKAIFTEKVNQAPTVEQVKKALEEAIQADAAITLQEEADKLKQNAKDAIDSIVGLTNEQKEEFKRRVDNATTSREINDILEEAKGLPQVNSAKEKIDALDNLNNAQKQALKDAIENDKTDYNINAVLTEAKELDNAMKYLKELQAQADELKNTDKYQNASNESKTNLDSALNAAKNVTPTATGTNQDKQSVDTLIDNLKKAITALAETPREQIADKTGLQAEYDKSPSVKESTKFTTADPDLKAAYEEELTKAKAVLDKPNATQNEIDDALNRLQTARYALNGQEPVNKNPQIVTQPHSIVVFKDTAITNPIITGEFSDDGAVANIKMMNNDGNTENVMGGLSVAIVDGQDGKKQAQITGTPTADVGTQERKLQLTDDTAKTTLTNAFKVFVVDANVKDQEAIQVQPGTTLTVADVKNKIQLSSSDTSDANKIDFDVILPENVPTSGQNQVVNAIVRLKAADVASDDFKNNFVAQDKVVPVTVNFVTYAATISETTPSDTNPVLINTTTPTTDEDKNALIEAVKNANKNEDNTSKFPNGTNFVADENGVVTITYPDRSTDTVTVPFKQKDSEKYNPTAQEFPINSPAVQDQQLTDEEKTTIQNAVTIPDGSQGTVVVPTDAKVIIKDNVPVVKVIVRYPDNTEDEVFVPVRQQDKGKYNPQLVEAVEVPISVPTNIGTVIENELDKEAIKNNVDVPAINGGEKPVVSKEIVSEIKEGTNDHAGKKVVEVEITYADNSKEKIEVPVKQADKEVKEPTLKQKENGDADVALISTKAEADVVVSDEDKAKIMDKVQLPENGTPTISENAKIELNESGVPVVEVKVTYPDKTFDTIKVPVKQADNVVYEPEVVTEAVKINSSTEDQTLIVDQTDKDAIIAGVTVPTVAQNDAIPTVTLLENPVVKVENGKPVVEAVVTYADGSQDIVKVPVIQKENAAKEPTLKTKENGEVDKAIVLSPTTEGTTITEQSDKDAIIAKVNVPEGGTAEVVEPSVVKLDQIGNPVVEVKVTYQDGTFDTIKVPVKQAEKEIKEPELKKKENGDVDVALISTKAEADVVVSDEDKAKIMDKVQLPENGIPTISENAKIELNENGVPVVEVIVTYPDKTFDTIKVPVKTSDNVVYEPTLKAQEVLVSVDTKEGTQLTEGDKAKVIANVEVPAVNENSAPVSSIKLEGESIVKEGEKSGVFVVVRYEDGTIDRIFVPVVTDTDKDGFSDEEEQQANTNHENPAETPQGHSSAERLDPTWKNPVVVVDVLALTAEEKTNVENEIRKHNVLPEGTVINVGNNGNVTVVYPDGSIDYIEANVIREADIPVVAPTVEVKDGEVIITPPQEHVTSLDITYTPEGQTQPITVTVIKDKTGTWNIPTDSDLKLNDDGTISIPKDKVADGTEVGVLAKNKDKLADTVSTVLVPKDENSTTANDVLPEKSEITAQPNGDIVIIPGENATVIEITYTPEGQTQPVKVAVEKDGNTWKLPEGNTDLVIKDGTVIIPENKVQGGTAILVVSKNGEAVSKEIASIVTPVKQKTNNAVITKSKDHVKTNDVSNVTLYSQLMAIAVGMLVFLGLKKKKD